MALAAALAGAGVPIPASLTGTATFEGAELIWFDATTSPIGRGLRTNRAGAAQIAAGLGEIGCSAIPVDMPDGTMHLIGMLRIRDLAIAWPRRTPCGAVEDLRARGMEVAFLPDDGTAAMGRALDAVTLGPRSILMPAGHPRMRDRHGGLGVAVRETPMEALAVCAGAVGCLTGVVPRDRARDG